MEGLGTSALAFMKSASVKQLRVSTVSSWKEKGVIKVAVFPVPPGVQKQQQTGLLRTFLIFKTMAFERIFTRPAFKKHLVQLIIKTPIQ